MRAGRSAPGGTIDDRRDRRTSIDDRSIDAIARSTDDRSRKKRDPPIADPAIRRFADPAIRVAETGRDGRTGDGCDGAHRDDGATDEDAVRVDAKG